MKPTYSDLIEAYARGEGVEFFDCTLPEPEWCLLHADNTVVLPSFLRTDGNSSVRFKFRLKPRTVKIGRREIEAPVLEPVEGRTVWYWDNIAWAPRKSSGKHEEWARDGHCFASLEACQAAHEAWVALMRGEA